MKAVNPSADASSTFERTTPMLQQYREIKAAHEDCILFFRMGDFYEMFFEDAEIASSILGIALTSRDRNKEDGVPMCGVPVHASEGYLTRLVQAGKRVAICEQVEDPKNAKGLVRREVVRVVTPGLIAIDGGLSAKNNNYIVSIGPCLDGGLRGISSLELSTGEFRLTEVSSDAEAVSEVCRLDPAEILLPEGEKDGHFAAGLAGALSGPAVSFRPDGWFRPERGASDLMRHFSVLTLDGFGLAGLVAGTGAAGALLEYARETQHSDLSHIRRILPYRLGDHLILDEATRRNLELVANSLDHGREGTLLSVLDRTVTPMGGRLLRNWILYPLMERYSIEARLSAVEALVAAATERQAARRMLRKISDMERLLGRVTLRTATPRDLLALKESLAMVPGIRDGLEGPAGYSELISGIRADLDPCVEVRDLIEGAIRPDAPSILRDGGVIREGFHPELDEIIAIQRDGRAYIARVENIEKERTGIASLKVGFNRVFGYYIEISKVHGEKVPESYIRKQTLVSAERYITPELKEVETRILTAQERKIALEHEIFRDIGARICRDGERIQTTARALSLLDCLASLAEVAVEYGYKRPVITDEDGIRIRQGRHPVVERTLVAERFVPNDVTLDLEGPRMIIITGPNMAGKSTVLRQTALIVLLAQMGSFVPADAAEIGIVDRIFTRVGATDYLSRGQSTFMVEMTETANILHNATPKSLVILDEIGRGTSTYDGLSIAWAVAEELLRKDGIGVKTLFATHYHELTALAGRYDVIRNMHISVQEWEGGIVFLRHLLDGPASRSYGIQVAALAGVPRSVIDRAKEILDLIENGGVATVVGRAAPSKKGRKRPVQMSLPLEPVDRFGLESRILNLDIDNLTPLNALKTLAELKELIKNG